MPKINTTDSLQAITEACARVSEDSAEHFFIVPSEVVIAYSVEAIAKTITASQMDLSGSQHDIFEEGWLDPKIGDYTSLGMCINLIGQSTLKLADRQKRPIPLTRGNRFPISDEVRLTHGDMAVFDCGINYKKPTPIVTVQAGKNALIMTGLTQAHGANTSKAVSNNQVMAGFAGAQTYLV